MSEVILYLAAMTKTTQILTVAPEIYVAAKYDMEEDRKSKNLELDRKLADELKSIGFIKAEQEISLLCGKERSYFSTMRARGYGLHLGSLTLLAARLANRIEKTSDVRERAKIRMALTSVNAAIQGKCQLRVPELHTR